MIKTIGTVEQKIHFLLYSTRREGIVDKLIEGGEKSSVKMQ